MLDDKLEQEARRWIARNFEETDKLTFDDLVRVYVTVAKVRNSWQRRLGKQIQELLGEAVEYREAIANLKDDLRRVTSDRDGYKTTMLSYEHKIKDLKNKVAELKKQQFSLRNERNTFLAQNEQYEKDLIDFNENLTKAKELIKKMSYEYQRLCLIKKETLTEAEQFIKDSEVEK